MLMYSRVHSTIAPALFYLRPSLGSSACKKLFALSSTQQNPSKNPALRFCQSSFQRAHVKRVFISLLFYFFSSHLSAAVLPEDRADVMFHSYDGGGAEISGPSLLVRKKFSENVSATVNHYVDNVSSASIDVITRASPYEEERIENSLSVDYLHDKTVMSMGLTESNENDFAAKTLSLNISQDMFGDLTTVSLGFALGDNLVGRNGDDTFSEDVDVRNYRISLSQVLTKDLVLALALETITDEGFLNNPYRSVRYIDPLDSLNYIYEDERYPNTRTSHATAIRAKYYLPHRAAIHGGFRYFTDTWGIEAQTFEVGYTWPYSEELILEFSYRLYDQTKADFYSDLFPFENAQNFLARDKELSTFSSNTLGLGAHYEFKKNGTGFIKRGSVNLSWDFIDFQYDDFRDLTVTGVPPGQEPLYDQTANVIRAYVSIWF